MNRSDIRVKAYAVFRRGREILVNNVRELDGTLKGFRIPGGHVEFGEKALDAVHREIMEELNAEINILNQLPMIESLYIYNNKPGMKSFSPGWRSSGIKAFTNARRSRHSRITANLLPCSGLTRISFRKIRKFSRQA